MSIPPPDPIDVDLSDFPDPEAVRRDLETWPAPHKREIPRPRPRLDRYKRAEPTGPPQTVKQRYSHQRYTMIRTLRPALLAVLSILTVTGILPPDIKAVIEANADAVIAGVMALWAITAAVRNRKDAKAAE